MKKIVSIILVIMLLFVPSCSKDEKNNSVETKIIEISKYGNIVLSVTPDELKEKGFEVADIINIEIGDVKIQLPIGSAYSDVDSGNMVCCYKTSSSKGVDEVVLAVNSGNLAEEINIAKINRIDEDPGYEVIWKSGYNYGTTVTLSMQEKGGYLSQYEFHQLGFSRTNKRADYEELSDAEYANFRAINTTNMGYNVLFRTSSPINPTLNRDKEADGLIGEYGIKTIINMVDNEETMKLFNGYSDKNYSKCKIIALNMGMDFTDQYYRDKLCSGLKYMINNEGPYLIHCKEGKDRTGFVCAILECLMGATLEEVINDYMITYYNFNKIGPDSDQYNKIAESNIIASLKKAFNHKLLENQDLAKSATSYLIELGLTKDEINQLKNNLRKNY